jgi:hypothetical protein
MTYKKVDADAKQERPASYQSVKYGSLGETVPSESHQMTRISDISAYQDASQYESTFYLFYAPISNNDSQQLQKHDILDSWTSVPSLLKVFA